MSEKRLTDALPIAIRPVAEKGVAWAKGLSKPAKIFIVSTVLALAVVGGYFGFHGATPQYTVLFNNLDRDDAAQVVAKLKEMKVPYRLEGDGATIEVPEEKARELRLELAGAGLPRGGAVGFESFDKMRLGATEFEQRIQYRRALEGELSRTISTVAAVQNARVHLVLPEKSVFVSKNEPSSASVVLKLRGGRALGTSEVNGIVHLVSTSVAGLSPDRVAVVTTEGQVLHKPKRPGEEAGSDDDRAAQARSLEASLEDRARTMVEKVMGPGHVDVRVTADIDSSRVERVEDRYDPNKTALRSEEKNVERSGEADIPAAGVPGAESNLPNGSAKGVTADGGAPAVASATANSGVTREQHTRNFEVDHITEKRVVMGGVLKRLTVAVILDDAPPAAGQPARSKEEVEKIAGLVRSAVGFDAQRGDVVTVEAVPFLAAEPAPAPAPAPSIFAKVEPKKAMVAAAGALVVLVIVLTLAVRRSKKKAASKALALVAAKEKASAEAVTVEILGAEPKKTESSDDLKKLVRERAQLDPATAALIVRSWLGNAEAREEAAA